MTSEYNDLGVLEGREISGFKQALVVSKMNENKNKLLKWLGIKVYNQLRFDNIRIPDSKIAALAIEEANDVYSPTILKHCYRTYFFSNALAFSKNLKIDEEFLFITAILHDVALTDKHNHICSKQCFAIYGGNFIKEFSLKYDVNEQRANGIKIAVDMHLNPDVDKVQFGNEAYSLSKGAAMDVIGAHSFQLSADFIDATHKKFPINNFKKDIINTMNTLNHKENTRADILFKMGFQKLASNNKLDAQYIKLT